MRLIVPIRGESIEAPIQSQSLAAIPEVKERKRPVSARFGLKPKTQAISVPQKSSCAQLKKIFKFPSLLYLHP